MLKEDCILNKNDFSKPSNIIWILKITMMLNIHESAIKRLDEASYACMNYFNSIILVSKKLLFVYNLQIYIPLTTF